MYFLFISILVFLLEILVPSASAQVTSITEFQDYVTARACVKDAVTSGMYYGTNQFYLGCGQQQSQTCLCGSVGAVSDKINQYIFSQASQGCGDTIEAASATGIFHEYCVAPVGADVASGGTTTIAASGSQSTATDANPQSKPANPAATSTPAGNNGGDNTNNINIKTGGASQTSSSHTPIIVGITVGLALLTVLGLSW